MRSPTSPGTPHRCQIPRNFVMTAHAYPQRLPAGPGPVGNPQTDAFLAALSLPHVVTLPFSRAQETAGVAGGVTGPVPLQAMRPRPPPGPPPGPPPAPAAAATDANEIDIDDIDDSDGEAAEHHRAADANEIDIDDIGDGEGDGDGCGEGKGGSGSEGLWTVDRRS